MKNLIAVIFLMLTTCGIQAKELVVTSPGGKMWVVLQDRPLSWEVFQGCQSLYTMKDLCLQTSTAKLDCAAPKSIKQRIVNETLKPVVPIKFSTVQNTYREVIINYGKYSIEMRVMDNAVAYRFVTRLGGEIEVTRDHFTFVPDRDYMIHRQPCGSFNTSYEEAYRHQLLNQWQEDDRKLSTIPCLMSSLDKLQLLLGEADCVDYPRLFLQPTDEGVESTHPHAPLSWEPWGDRGERITEAEYIAKTSGTRTFPWRYVVASDSRGIQEQTLTLQLSQPCKIADPSWIRPGKVSWEWWNGAAPWGTDVDFRVGCNYETYAYYADFASKYGIEYILLDEGWAKSTRDPFVGRDDLHLDKLIQYAKSKGVGVILWLPWLTVEQHMDLFEKYEQWGVAGVKIDFMDHADQWMVNYYRRVVEAAAEHHLLVDLHGSFTPAGLEYEYPNYISCEGVRGLEQMGGCHPDNTLYLPFIRNAVGPADFTPGGMNNMQPEYYRAERPNSGAMGTRCFQMALYVVLESGLQMLADNPTRYYQNDECTRYIASVPTTWDETRCLDAKAGKYTVVAKRKGDKWFLAALNNSEVNGREVEITLDFLGEGDFQLTGFRDGCNADYQAMHYNNVKQTVSRNTKLSIMMSRNGGFAAVIQK